MADLADHPVAEPDGQTIFDGIALAVRRRRRHGRLTVMPSAGGGHAFITATLRF